VEPHEGFRREGDDFYSIVPIGVHEAALGAHVDVPDARGDWPRCACRPGTQSGQRFRPAWQRARRRRAGGERGDLVVEVRIALPKVLDERSKRLLREFGRINGERS
jgi:molecular chaperone DnaJ